MIQLDLSPEQLKSELFEIKDFFVRFLPRPIETIAKCPDWSWRKIILAQAVVSLLCGTLGGIISLSFGQILLGIFITPITSTILTFLTSFFFHYTFMILSPHQGKFRIVHTVVFLALVPFFIFNSAASVSEFFSLFGAIIASFLLIVGFVENLGLNRKIVSRVVLGFIGVLFVFWIASTLKELEWSNWPAKKNNQAPEVYLGK